MLPNNIILYLIEWKFGNKNSFEAELKLMCKKVNDKTDKTESRDLDKVAQFQHQWSVVDIHLTTFIIYLH